MPTITYECPAETLSTANQFAEDILIGTDDSLNAAISRLSNLPPIEAVQVVIASILRGDAALFPTDLDQFADRLGVFDIGCASDDDEDEASGAYGRCDSCGAPCDEEGCTSNRSHMH